MKVLLALLSALTIGGSASELSIEANATQHMPHTPVSTKGNDSAMNLSQAPYDPNHPSFSRWPNIATSASAHNTKGDVVIYGNDGKGSYNTIKISHYAANWDSFKDNFKTIKVYLKYSLHGSHSKRGGHADVDDELTNYSINVSDISTTGHGSDQIKPKTNNDNAGIDNPNYWNWWQYDVHKYTFSGGSRGNVAVGSRVWHDNSNIYVSIAVAAVQGYGSGNPNPWGNITLTQVDVNSPTDTKKSVLNNAMKSKFVLNSKTSSLANSNLIHSIIDGKDYKANAVLVREEMWNRITKALGVDLAAWNSEVVDESRKPFLTKNTFLDPNTSPVKIAKDNSGNWTANINGIQDASGSRGLVGKGKFPKDMSMPIELKYDKSGFQDQIAKAFGKTLEFTSDFSSDLKDNKSFSSKKEGAVSYKSNKRIIDEEIDKRIHDLIPNEADYKLVKSMITSVSYSPDDAPNNVIINFAAGDNKTNNYIDNQQWVSSVSMPVVINLSDLYFKRSIADRLTVQAGQIIDTKNQGDTDLTKNMLKEDYPSYDDSTKTYTYHNSVSLSFNSAKGLNEVLMVDGKPVQMLDNKSHITLKDKRKLDNSNALPEPTVYQVEVSTPDPKNNVKFTIAIDSVANNINYQWLGWHPSSDPTDSISYNQWLLTAPKVPDETTGKMVDNPKYNPLIDKTTGMISDKIYVKGKWFGSDGKPKDYPFADDVLDQNNELIRTYTDTPEVDSSGNPIMDSDGAKDPDGNLLDPKMDRTYTMNGDDHFEDGYIAEAVLANSGIINLTKDLDNVDHVERVRLDPDTLQEIGTPESLTPEQLTKEAQFSGQGLWHYIIYRKDYVDKKLSPKKASDNITTPATSGSTIHKLLYINGKVADTGDDFLQLVNKGVIGSKATLDNEPVINAFWNTNQAEHLKQYLITKGFDSDGIRNASYENIIAYWYQYVSDVQSGLSIPPMHYYYNLANQNEINPLKFNSEDKKKILANVKDSIVKWLKENNGLDLDYGSDYIISTNWLLPKPITEEDLSKFVADYKNNNSSSMKLYVVALNTSVKAKGYKQFTILDSKDVNPDLNMDISKFVFSNIEYNFDNVLDNIDLDNDSDDDGELKTSLAEQYAKFVKDFAKKWIDEHVEETLINNRPEGQHKAYVYGKDYVITWKGRDTDYHNDDDTVERLEKFLAHSSKFKPIRDNRLGLEIKALTTSPTLSGQNSFKLINNPTGEVAPKWVSKLSTVFPNTDLGDIPDENSDGYINAKEVWDKMNEINPQAEEDYPQLKFEMLKFVGMNGIKQWFVQVNNDENSPEGTWTDEFKGSEYFTYTTERPVDPSNEKIQIKDKFRTTKIGRVADVNGNGKADDNAEIWRRLLIANALENEQDKNLTYAKFLIGTSIRTGGNDKESFYTVKVSAIDSNPVYAGSIWITYTTEAKVSPVDPANPDHPEDHKKDISDIFKITNLGLVEDENANGKIEDIEFWDRLLDVNGFTRYELPFNKFHFSSWKDKVGHTDSEDTWSIKVIADEDNDSYTGSVYITYNVSKGVKPVPTPKPDKPENHSGFTKEDWKWLAPVLIFGSAGLAVAIYFIVRRVKTKKKVK